MEIFIGLALLLLVLYVAYKLGKFVIKVVLGLVVMVLIAGVVWQYCGSPGGGRDSIAGMKDRIGELYQTLTSSAGGEEVAKAMRAFSAQAKQIGREKLAEFKEKQLPAIREKARKYKEELDRQGKLKEAQEFWDRFTKWVEEFDRPSPPNK